MGSEAIYYTAEELSRKGREEIPAELISNTHLIYSSPATLAFNSPGAEGFGVKRAALSVPESVMLLVAPGCCGRNTSAISSMRAYHHRYFYLMMDETDLVTGRHLKVIPEAVEEVCNSLEKKPEVVMICITCVDALLGTDMERVCRRAEERTGVRVKPCYMYALTREGRKPPMVHVRQSIYSMLEQRQRRSSSVNIMGFFAPLNDGSELYDLLRQAGVRTIREIGRCKTYEEFQGMAEANFNLVLNPEARFAAEDLQYKLGIPSVELTRLYQIDRISRQYEAFGQALGVHFETEEFRKEAEAAVERFRQAYPETVFAVGEAMNGNPFELALALTRYGFRVAEIYGTIAPEYYVYVNKLAQLSPETKIYSNLEPTMLYYRCSESAADLTIGKDAGYYHPDCPNVQWNSDVQPFGYEAVRDLFNALYEAKQGEEARK